MWAITIGGMAIAHGFAHGSSMDLVRSLAGALTLTLTVPPLALAALAALAIVPTTGPTIPAQTAFLHPLSQLLPLGWGQDFAHRQHALKAQVAHLLHLRLNAVVLLAELIGRRTTRHQPAHFLASGLNGLALLLHATAELLAHLALKCPRIAARRSLDDRAIDTG
jgi:hypothetical protein